MSELADRIERLETAVKALATREFGDVSGHPFHGNQWKGSGEASDAVTRASNHGINFQNDHAENAKHVGSLANLDVID